MKVITIANNQTKKVTLAEPGEYLIELIGQGAEVEVYGVFKANGREIKDVNVTLVHKAPHTRANTTLKGVVRDSAQLKFTGRIIIDKNCPDTNSFLTEKILLLSDQAKAEAVPDLEIESDDVKCSHAATIGRIPEEQLLYLMSRGLSRGSAEDLIVDGFLGE